MKMSIPQLFVLAASLGILVGLMSLMVTRKLRSGFPYFFSYLVLMTASTVVSLCVFLFAPQQYFYVYWSLSSVIMLLGFAVLYEVFVNILKPYSAVIDLGKMLFLWAGSFLLVAALLTVAVTSGPTPNKLRVAVDLCDRCVHLMQCGMLMLLVLFERRLNLSWRSHAMCIAIGTGVSAAIDIVVSYGQGRFPGMASQLDSVNGFSFVAVLAFWAYSLTAKQAVRKTAADSPTRLILQRWNEALTGYGYGDVAYAANGADSFLPNVERTVDRVMARKVVR